MRIGTQTGAAVERAANKVLCLRFLSSAPGPRTVGAISLGTGLSRPTVGAVLAELVAESVVEQIDPRNIGSGRPAREFEFIGAAAHVAGVDVGPHGIRVIVADLSGRQVGRFDGPVDLGGSVVSQLRGVVERVEAVCVAGGVPTERLRSVCVAVPGIIGAEGVSASLAIPDWVGHPAAARLSAELGCPVMLENDIKLAALAEHKLGAGRGVSDLVYLQIGNRVSLALVIEGAIRQGAHRLAGELGSLRGMKWAANSERGQLIWRSAPTSAELFSRAEQGDDVASSEISEFCDQIAERIAAILLTVDPTVVVIGGGMSRAGELFLGPLRAAVHRLLMIPELPPIIPSRLPLDATVLGALGTAFDAQSSSLYGIDGYPTPWDRLLEHPPPHPDA
ncbi:ROK family transcriptional regulator [Leifsonia poae]|uniref:ROK family transcriptional regulator n=1 Tax=Leifsonia poae TaxID=110933 RepID=UPI001CBE335D|nr:ROK family transcriptional regulator [Leifsonia poae]